MINGGLQSENYEALFSSHMSTKTPKRCRLVDLEAVVDDGDTTDASLDEAGLNRLSALSEMV